MAAGGECAEERKAGAAGRKAWGDHGGRGVRWEFLVTRLCMRVLLVEADDASRRIIAALLRKCSYRVAAAADGLKAWETLKEKSQDIDLVLTEVELPSISGYDLLTMITEHESCKNIPVIMMSSHDSINIVFKCMLMGAADFLIKPIRKNELRNLWQHVWRRHSSYGHHGVRYMNQDEIFTEQKNVASSENGAASNHSRETIVSLRAVKEYDTITSCTRPDVGAKSEYTQNMLENIHPDCINSVVNDVRNHKDDVCEKLAEKLPMQESESEVNANIQHEEKNEKDCQRIPSREVDLIGTLDKQSCSNYAHKSCIKPQSEISNDAEIFDAKDNQCQLSLELTLSRDQFIRTYNQETDKVNMLNHSNSSAFSRYNRTVPSLPLTSTGFEYELGPSRDQGLFNVGTSLCSGGSLNMHHLDSPIGVLPTQHGSISSSHPGLLPIPVPIAATAYGLSSSYCLVIPPLFYGQLGTPVRNLEPTNHESIHSSLSYQSDHETFCSGPHGDPPGQHVQENQMQKEHMHNIESLIDQSPTASVTGQSRSICKGNRTRANSGGSAGVCNGSSGNPGVTSVSSDLENANGNGLLTHGELNLADSHRSIPRQAALIKFLFKRKKRCREKRFTTRAGKGLQRSILG